MKRAKTRLGRWLKRIAFFFGAIFLLIIILLVISSSLRNLVISGIGYIDIYNGNNERGNKMMLYAMSKKEKLSASDYHAFSIHNTKNGNYSLAIDALEKAYQIDSADAAAYIGWVLLYYYRDYERSLEILEYCDQLTPNFSDAPQGEDIHYLKGLAYMQLNQTEKAIEEFDWYINEMAKKGNEEYVDVYAFVQKGRCLAKLEKHEEAIKSFEKAIHYYEHCTEANYFMALSEIALGENEKACNNLAYALNKIKKGYKSTDNYIEFFHAIYTQDIELSIIQNCKN
jgi:tetratricopeptide (TPR) repeat protein